MTFNPDDFMIKLKGKDYMPVQGRMVWYRSQNTEDTAVKILDKIIDQDKGFAYFEVEITDSNGNVEVGVGSETRQDFRDFIEKAYTKAYGRALAALGYGTQFAAEFDEGDRILDAPTARPTQSNTSSPTNYTPPKMHSQGSADYQAPAADIGATSSGGYVAGEQPVTKEQLNEIGELMTKSGTEPLEMSRFTKETFGKSKSIDLTNGEALILIGKLKEKIEEQ